MTALVVSSVVALFLVAIGSGALLRLGLVLCLLLAVGAGAVAVTTGRRTMSIARAEVSRERAARMREVEHLQRRILEVQDAGRALSIRLDGEGARIAGLRADAARWQRSSEMLRPTLLLPLLTEAMRRSAPVPLARVRVRIDDAAALARALAPRVGAPTRVEPAQPIQLPQPIPLPQSIPLSQPIQPLVAVLREFSLIGLAAFPRPAGMPDPGLPLVAPAQVVDLTEGVTIDLRATESRVEQTGT